MFGEGVLHRKVLAAFLVYIILQVVFDYFDPRTLLPTASAFPSAARLRSGASRCLATKLVIPLGLRRNGSKKIAYDLRSPIREAAALQVLPVTTNKIFVKLLVNINFLCVVKYDINPLCDPQSLLVVLSKG